MHDGGLLGYLGEAISALVGLGVWILSYLRFDAKIVAEREKRIADKNLADERHINLLSEKAAMNRRIDQVSENMQKIEREVYNKIDKIGSDMMELKTEMSKDMSEMKSDIKLLIELRKNEKQNAQ